MSNERFPERLNLNIIANHAIALFLPSTLKKHGYLLFNVLIKSSKRSLFLRFDIFMNIIVWRQS